MSAPEAPKRLRVLHVLVQPVLVWDDGDTLTPAQPVQPRTCTLADLPDLAEAIVSELAEANATPPA